MATVSLKRILLALALVLGLLAGVIWTVVSYRLKQASGRTPERDAYVLRGAIEQWLSQKHECPTVSQLRDEKYLDPELTNDPWGSPYLIECVGEMIEIHSLGPDRQRSTPDDVIVRRRNRG